MSKKIIHKTGNQVIKRHEICAMKIHIGHVIEQVYKKSKIGGVELAELLHCSRSTVYHIFKSETIQTDMLLNLCKILRHDFFAHYSRLLKDDNPNMVNEPEATYPPIVAKRKVMVEVYLPEK